MCEFSQRLIAWLDGELPEGEAAKMERHLGECAQCRGQLDAYRQASDAFEAYSNACADAAMSAKSAKRGRRSLRPAQAVSAAAAIAAMVATFFLFTARVRHSAVVGTAAEIGSTTAASQPVHTAQQEPARQLAAVAPPGVTPQVVKSKGAERISHPAPDRRTEAPRPQENTNLLPGAPAVEISIPADAIFPPGAVPAGVSFTADVTMASDGSTEQIRLRPQLTEFERKGAQR
ncbi:MAG TPA: anti-sigma factor [Candidatus Acidoferrales bacterium]|nr:anti-sigma factor [Candidatus Acidoferrales bacterium]